MKRFKIIFGGILVLALTAGPALGRAQLMGRNLGALASGSYIGLGAAAGRIVFNDAATDEIHFLGALSQFGTAAGAGQVNITPASAIVGLDIVQANAAYGINVDSATTSPAIRALGGQVAEFTQDVSNGYGLYVERNIGEAGTTPLVRFINNHVSNTQHTLLVDHDGTSTGNALYVDSESTDTYAMVVTGMRTTWLKQDISNGNALRASRNIAEAGAEPLVNFINDHASNTQSTLFIDHDGTGGATGYGLHVDSENVAGPAVKIEGGTSGILLDLSNDAVTPTLAFGDGDTGFYETADDTINVAINGGEVWQFTNTTMGVANGNKAQLSSAVPTRTVPNILPIGNDPDTGISTLLAEPDTLSLIAGGVEAMRFTEASSAVLQAVEINPGLTADAGSAQGNGVITSSYNTYNTVGTAGDAATLPATFAVGTIVFIKNDAAANAMDVFPASGDDLGEGADTALSLVAGKGAIFVGTVADSTWTNILEGI